MLADPALEARARAVSKELRCMVCQNQSIDDSDAPLAHDLRVLVRERLKAGDSDAQVMNFLVARYGEFVLLRPPLAWHTAALWGLPPAALLVGLAAIVVVGAAAAPRRSRWRGRRNLTALRKKHGCRSCYAKAEFARFAPTRATEQPLPHYEVLILPTERRKAALSQIRSQIRGPRTATFRHETGNDLEKVMNGIHLNPPAAFFPRGDSGFWRQRLPVSARRRSSSRRALTPTIPAFLTPGARRRTCRSRPSMPQHPVGFADIVAKVKPAVISVRVKMERPTTASPGSDENAVSSRLADRSLLQAVRHAQW